MRGDEEAQGQMNFQAAVKGIAPAGGIRPASHITASFVSATKAKPAAHYFVGQRSKRGAPYGVSCGRERDMAYWSCRPQIIRHPTTLATMVTRASEKVRPHRPRQIFRCAPRSVRHHERPLPWKASRLRDPSAGFWQDVPMGHRSGGSESNRQGTLTITGSNVHRGTEMPVALSLF